MVEVPRDCSKHRIKLEIPDPHDAAFLDKEKRAGTALPVSTYTLSTRKNRLHTFRQMGKGVLNGLGRHIGVA
ncbi:MAG: hypothetical protein WAS50_17635, partial [Nitrospira sp.]